MDSIETNYCDSTAFAATCFGAMHTPKGRMWVRVAFTAFFIFALIAAGPISWDLFGLIHVLKVTSFVVGCYVVWRVMLPFGAVTGYAGPNQSHRTMGYKTNKIIRYTINKQQNTFEIEQQSTDTDSAPEVSSHPLDEIEVHKKLGSIYLVHRNTVFALLWTSANLAFVEKLNSYSAIAE